MKCNRYDQFAFQPVNTGRCAREEKSLFERMGGVWGLAAVVLLARRRYLFRRTASYRLQRR